MKAPFPWYGGKKNVKELVVNKILQVLDINDTRQTYFEPFVGGGTIVFNLEPNNAVVSDINCWLINLYHVIKNDLVVFLKKLDKFEDIEADNPRYFFDLNKRKFNELKDKHPVNPSSFSRKPDTVQIELAARFYYMCKRGFGGIVSVLPDGNVNVRFAQSKIDGRYLYDVDNIDKVSEFLQDVTLKCGDYMAALKGIKKGDVVYIDPPYYSEKPSQDSYWKTEFGLKEQERLANYVWSLHDKGIYVIVSNSDHPVIRKFYKGLKLRQLNLRRTVNMFSTKNHSELLITNF